MRHLLVSAVLAMGIAPVASAQVSLAMPRFGVTAGLNIAKIDGDSVNGAKNKTGFSFGATVALPMGSGFSFAPELAFTTKGTKFSEQGIPDASFKLNYFELPLLLRYDFPVTGKTKPFVLAGPALAFQTSCKISGEDQGVTVSVKCKDFTDNDIKTFDAGAMFGGGLAFDLGGKLLSFGVRYNLGLKDIFSDTDAKNRVLSFVGTYEFLPLR